MRPTTKKIARDYGSAVLIAVIVAVFIRFWVIEAYRIPTGAMHPTLEPGDTIFVAKWPIGFNRKVERGDVLIFGAPSEPDRDYIKRVLAVAGDTVEIKNGKLLLNGKPGSANDLPKKEACGPETLPLEGTNTTRTYEVCWEPPFNKDFGPEKVPSGSVFVLGDLRSLNPLDLKKHHTWGLIPIESIKGKALWIWLSIEPNTTGVSALRFPNFRFERMFRRIL